MRLKETVSLAGVRPEAVVGLIVAEELLRSLGYELTVTSCMDGKHKDGSKHYLGYAFDMRIFDMADGMPATVRNKLERSLGPQFDVILERDHIHVEFDPKPPAEAGVTT